MTRFELIEQIRKKKSLLCIGLDSDLSKIPEHLLTYSDPIYEFNKQIIDATHDLCVAYKPNTAFYERHGEVGWRALKKTIDYIPENCLIIADAKRGDIGNTSNYYAQAFFNTLGCDALTVNPYMGEDSVAPFLNYTSTSKKHHWIIVLALTSNTGSFDFQLLADVDGTELYKKVLEKTIGWGTAENTMFVVGATQADKLREVRKIAPEHFILVPGIGQQGGSLKDVINYGKNKDYGLLINASRSIIYASRDIDFAEKARVQAQNMQQEIASLIYF